jgi:hypothetical protein
MFGHMGVFVYKSTFFLGATYTSKLFSERHPQLQTTADYYIALGVVYFQNTLFCSLNMVTSGLPSKFYFYF